MSTALLPTTVNAAEYTSNGAITFEADPNPTNPVDPTDPEKPVDPVDPTDPDGPNPGTPGPLS
ncbi:WxL domain-containing protein, partial [Enterococcus casseliflavus]